MERSSPFYLNYMTSVNGFKKALKTHLFRKAFRSLFIIIIIIIL